MSDRRAPLVVHPWIGPLYQNGDHELIGSVELDPGDAEVLLEVPDPEPGRALEAHVKACATRLRQAVDQLPQVKHYILEHAPRDWVHPDEVQPGTSVVDRLQLRGAEVSRRLRVSLTFGLGEVETIMVQLDGRGHGEEVFRWT